MSCAAELVYIMYHGDHKSHNTQNMELDILFYSTLSTLAKVPFILYLKCIYHLPPPYNFRWAISLFCSHIQQRYLIDQVRWIRFEFSNCLSNRAKVKKSPKPIFFYIYIIYLFPSLKKRSFLPPVLTSPQWSLRPLNDLPLNLSIKMTWITSLTGERRHCEIRLKNSYYFFFVMSCGWTYSFLIIGTFFAKDPTPAPKRKSN